MVSLPSVFEEVFKDSGEMDDEIKRDDEGHK